MDPPLLQDDIASLKEQAAIHPCKTQNDGHKRQIRIIGSVSVELTVQQRLKVGL